MKTEQQYKEKVPLFSSWKGWYSLVLGVLVLLIIAFYFFTKHYA